MGRWLNRIKTTNTASKEPAAPQVSSVLSVSTLTDRSNSVATNEGFVSSVSARHKQLLHLKRKKSLGHRIQILRILIWRILNDIRHEKNTGQAAFIVNDSAVESLIDYEIIHHDYDLEAAIDSCRSAAREPVLFCKCGYQPPFCSCGGIPIPGIVSCHSCVHFSSDKIGDGAGVGRCAVGVESTQEVYGCMPLFRYVNRHCDKFSGVI
jgi:hypothetical protein